jgi:hypothetical protein
MQPQGIKESDVVPGCTCLTAPSQGFKGITLTEVIARAKYAQSEAKGAQFGTMLWCVI